MMRHVLPQNSGIPVRKCFTPRTGNWCYRKKRSDIGRSRRNQSRKTLWRLARAPDLASEGKANFPGLGHLANEIQRLRPSPNSPPVLLRLWRWSPSIPGAAKCCDRTRLPWIHRSGEFPDSKNAVSLASPKVACHPAAFSGTFPSGRQK